MMGGEDGDWLVRLLENANTLSSVVITNEIRTASLVLGV